MEWDEYLKSVLKKEKCLDNIKVEVDNQETDIPSIVKASVFLLEKMMKKQGNRNLFVFPDGDYIPFIFMLSKVIYNIYSGKIENQYSPEDFEVGQILKLGNCITQFLGVGEHPAMPGKKVIFLKFADVDKNICPLDIAPYFQVSDTKKKLSKYASYVKAKKELAASNELGNNLLQDLKAIKTHVNESIFYVSTVADSERKANEIKVDGEKLFEYLLIAKTDYSGDLFNYKGKYVGTPALVFSSQLSYVNTALLNGAKVQSVIINLNECDVNAELDALDELLQRKIPVLCIADTINSFDLAELKNRKFNIWRWDEDSISGAVFDGVNTSAEEKLNKCVHSNVVYHDVESAEISEAFRLIYKYNHVIENESADMNKIYSKLLSIAYLTVRNICNLGDDERKAYISSLEGCAHVLEIESNFIEPQMYKDFEKAINLYFKIMEKEKVFNKTEEIYNFLIERRYERFYLVCSNHDNVEAVKKYWVDRLAKSGYRPNIYVVYPKEFIALDNIYSDIAILAGWFSANIVKKIIYGYKVKEIHVYTYECEERWKRAHTKAWKKGLNNESNRNIVQKSFSTKILNIPTNQLKEENLNEDDSLYLQQQDDFDLIVQESKYRQYAARGGAQGDIVVDARPVGFVGGDFALYTQGHKILVATKIIAQLSKQIEKKEVNELKIGDFIVVREADKDIIREVADKILEANHRLEYRKTAALWKEALRIEEAFSSIEDIYNRLVSSGCKRNYVTVRNWLTSEEIIIPQDTEDLRLIAEVTGDEVLLEKLDEIITAGNYIKNAHIKAGKVLSERLTESIAVKLLSEKTIDPFNIWEPIELELDEVGTVKVLKIVDIAQTNIPVEASNANKVLAEEKESLLWQE